MVLVVAGHVLNVHPPCGLAQTPKKNEPQAQAKQQASRSQISSMESSILSLTNRERKNHGFAPLELSLALTHVARKHSRNMCRTSALLHESEKFPAGWRTFEERMRHVRVRSGAENIAYRTWTGDERKWAEHVVTGWINSSQHRKNILRPDYKFLGVGVFLCDRGIAFATQIFSTEGAATP
jgi:uncharacterized protein YkwD